MPARVHPIETVKPQQIRYQNALLCRLSAQTSNLLMQMHKPNFFKNIYKCILCRQKTSSQFISSTRAPKYYAHKLPIRSCRYGMSVFVKISPYLQSLSHENYLLIRMQDNLT